LITQEAILEKLSRNSELYNERFDKIEQYATKLNLSNEDILEIASAKVWLTSEKKLDFIKQRLEKNNLTSRREIIERQIEVELKRRSEEYLIYLDRFNSSV
jgi:bifunctional pyridoxal-dependent enzyme with beta-cystathionase and maltose regulon repressor activities